MKKLQFRIGEYRLTKTLDLREADAQKTLDRAFVAPRREGVGG